MLKTRFLIAATGGLLIAGCENPTGPHTLPLGPMEAAHAVTLNEPHAPFEFVVPACEEEVAGSGILHVLSLATISAHEDTLTAFHINARGTGIGADSGDRYRFNDVFRFQTHQNSGLPLLVRFTEVLNLIGQGRAANLHLHTTFLLVIDANGIQRAAVDEVRLTCT